MAEDEKAIEEIFAEYQLKIHECMLETFERKKRILELKSKIGLLEEQKNKLKESNKMMKTIINKSGDLKERNSDLNSAIEEATNSINTTKKDIATLESERKNEQKPSSLTKKIVPRIKTMLSEVSTSGCDSHKQKEKRLLELKKQVKEFKNDSNTLKHKQELDSYIKEYELLKAKNIRLKEMIKIAIEKNI